MASLEVYTAALSKKMFGARSFLGTTVPLPLPTKVRGQQLHIMLVQKKLHIVIVTLTVIVSFEVCRF